MIAIAASPPLASSSEITMEVPPCSSPLVRSNNGYRPKSRRPIQKSCLSMSLTLGGATPAKERPSFLQMGSERLVGRRGDSNSSNNGKSMMGNRSHHGRGRENNHQPSRTSSSEGVFTSFRRISLDQNAMLQVLQGKDDLDCNSGLLRRASVHDYQEVFQQMKSENPHSSLGALQQKTMTKIAALKALQEEKEERLKEVCRREEEEERIRNQTAARKRVGKWVGKMRQSQVLRDSPGHGEEQCAGVTNGKFDSQMSGLTESSRDSDSPPSKSEQNKAEQSRSEQDRTERNALRASFMRRQSEVSGSSRNLAFSGGCRNIPISNTSLNYRHASSETGRSMNFGSSFVAPKRAEDEYLKVHAKPVPNKAGADGQDFNLAPRLSVGDLSAVLLGDNALAGPPSNTDADESVATTASTRSRTSGATGEASGAGSRSKERAFADSSSRHDHCESESTCSRDDDDDDTDNDESRESLCADLIFDGSSEASDPVTDLDSTVGGDSVAPDDDSESDSDRSCAPRSDGLIVGFVDRSPYVCAKYGRVGEANGLIVGFYDRNGLWSEEGTGGVSPDEDPRCGGEKGRKRGVRQSRPAFEPAPSPYGPAALPPSEPCRKWFQRSSHSLV